VKEIQKVISKIEAQQKTIERVQTDRDGALATIEGASAHVATLDELKAQRRRQFAEAMVAKKTPNTTAIDAQVENAEQQHKAAQAAAATARDALGIYDEGLRMAEGELDSLREQLRTAIGAEILARHDAGVERYTAAVASMEEAVAEIVAANRAWTQAAAALDGQPFPAHGERLLTEIREVGLRVPYTASRLADPRVAEEYTEDYQGFWHPPTWADPLTQDFALERTADLVDALIKAGVACSPIKRPEPPERQVKVRITKGTIHTAAKVMRSAETHQIISSESVYFEEGDDVWLAESDARRLKALRRVAIHGEDEMPPPKAKQDPSAPRVVDMSPPSDNHANVLRPGNAEYAGHFHKMDLSAYE
jgi:hypothetical protein